MSAPPVPTASEILGVFTPAQEARIRELLREEKKGSPQNHFGPELAIGTADGQVAIAFRTETGVAALLNGVGPVQARLLADQLRTAAEAADARESFRAQLSSRAWRLQTQPSPSSAPPART